MDQGKSVKSFLMRLFGDHHAVEGTDVYNACYGGTAALLNSVAWMQSRAWDGRLGLVVAVDLCPQEEKFAFFQGAAAVAMLVGPGEGPLCHGTGRAPSGRSAVQLAAHRCCCRSCAALNWESGW